jgi:hypothetical protein
VTQERSFFRNLHATDFIPTLVHLQDGFHDVILMGSTILILKGSMMVFIVSSFQAYTTRMTNSGQASAQ